MNPASDEYKNIAYLKLSVQRALLGMVTPRMIAVTAGYTTEGHVMLVGYFDSPATEDDRLHLSAIASEVVADFYEHRGAGARW